MTKTSAPRTFSWISTKISMSANRRTTALVIGVPIYLPIASASAGLELPATSLIAPFLPVIPALLRRLKARLREHDPGKFKRRCAGGAQPLGKIMPEQKHRSDTSRVQGWQYESKPSPGGFSLVDWDLNLNRGGAW